MKSVLIIGIGRFGKHLAVQMAERKNEVMIVDQDESRVQDIMPLVTSVQIGNCRQQEVLESLGVNNFDLCFVCIGDDFQSSLEITLLLKELGAKYVVSKARRDIHAKFLLRNGADEVIYPEKDMARRVAMRFSAHHVYDYVEMSPEYMILEIEPPKAWLGKSIGDMQIRGAYGINIIAVKSGGHFKQLPGPNYKFHEDEHLIVAGDSAHIEKILHRL